MHLHAFTKYKQNSLRKFDMFHFVWYRPVASRLLSAGVQEERDAAGLPALLRDEGAAAQDDDQTEAGVAKQSQTSGQLTGEALLPGPDLGLGKLGSCPGASTYFLSPFYCLVF